MNKLVKFKNFNLFSLLFILSLVTVVGFGCGDDDDDDDDDSYDDDDMDDDDSVDDDDDDMGDDDDDTGDDDDDTTEPEDSWVRAIHLSPDAPNVDVYVNGSILAFEDLAFEESSAYATLEEGTYTFDITATGGSVEDAVLTIPDLALAGNTYYTAVAFNLLAEIQPLALVDDYSELDEGNIRIRAIHTAAGVGEVDIWVIPGELDPFILFEDLGFAEAADYAEVSSGAYTLGIDVDDDEVPDLIFDVPELAEGTVANVFAIKDGDDVLLLAQFEDGTVALINSNPPV